MALIKCKDCGSEISDQAKNCPQCGKPIKKDIGCFSMIGIFLIGFIVICYIIGNNSEKENVNYCTGKEILAYNYAEDFVKNKLKSPSSAKFPETKDKIKHTTCNYDECSYTIRSWVESTNSFGAMIKTEFECTIYFKDDKVQCSKITFY